MHIVIEGAGVAGLALAGEFVGRARLTVVERQGNGLPPKASWLAGGMLAPWCEAEAAGPEVARLGAGAADWWERQVPGAVSRNGTLVVALARDQKELARFAERTSHYEWLDEQAIADLEPDLAGRFRRALFFPQEAHLDPRQALTALRDSLERRGVRFAGSTEEEADFRFDCRGAGAIGEIEGLRGVRGEMAILETSEIRLSRPVRLLHPRIPLYIVPRAGGRFMCGATMIETEDAGPVAVRSLMELLNAAYSLHPAFGEARLIEASAGIRPAFPDNMPKLVRRGATIAVTGFYRHGFLAAPHLAKQAAELAFAPIPAGDMP